MPTNLNRRLAEILSKAPAPSSSQKSEQPRGSDGRFIAKAAGSERIAEVLSGGVQQSNNGVGRFAQPQLLDSIPIEEGIASQNPLTMEGPPGAPDGMDAAWDEIVRAATETGANVKGADDLAVLMAAARNPKIAQTWACR